MQGVVILDAKGIVEEASETVCAWLGYSRREIVGLHGSELIPRDAQPATAASIDRMRRGELSRRSGHLRRKDGGVIRIEVVSCPLENGRLALGLRLSEDVSEG